MKLSQKIDDGTGSTLRSLTLGSRAEGPDMRTKSPTYLLTPTASMVAMQKQARIEVDGPTASGTRSECELDVSVGDKRREMGQSPTPPERPLYLIESLRGPWVTSAAFHDILRLARPPHV